MIEQGKAYQDSNSKKGSSSQKKKPKQGTVEDIDFEENYVRNIDLEEASFFGESTQDKSVPNHSVMTVVVNNATIKDPSSISVTDASQHLDLLVKNALNEQNCSIFVCDQVSRSKRPGSALDDMVT